MSGIATAGGSREGLDDRRAERGQVVRVAARDTRPRRRRPPRPPRLPPALRMSVRRLGNEVSVRPSTRPASTNVHGAVADRADRLARLEHVLHEREHVVVHPQPIRVDGAARQDQPVVVGGADVAVAPVHPELAPRARCRRSSPGSRRSSSESISVGGAGSVRPPCAARSSSTCSTPSVAMIATRRPSSVPMVSSSGCEWLRGGAYPPRTGVIPPPCGPSTTSTGSNARRGSTGPRRWPARSSSACCATRGSRTCCTGCGSATRCTPASPSSRSARSPRRRCSTPCGARSRGAAASSPRAWRRRCPRWPADGRTTPRPTRTSSASGWCTRPRTERRSPSSSRRSSSGRTGAAGGVPSVAGGVVAGRRRPARRSPGLPAGVGRQPRRGHHPHRTRRMAAARPGGRTFPRASRCGGGRARSTSSSCGGAREVTVLADRCSHLSAPLSDGELGRRRRRRPAGLPVARLAVPRGRRLRGPRPRHGVGAALRDPHDRPERGDAGRARSPGWTRRPTVRTPTCSTTWPSRTTPTPA